VPPQVLQYARNFAYLAKNDRYCILHYYKHIIYVYIYFFLLMVMCINISFE
jgi:hypothetical protein